MTDRMAMALTAVELVSGATTHTDEETLALLDGHSMYDMHVLLSSVVWCAFFMAGELARQMGVTRADVVEALRLEVLGRFENYKPEGENQ